MSVKMSNMSKHFLLENLKNTLVMHNCFHGCLAGVRLSEVSLLSKRTTRKIYTSFDLFSVDSSATVVNLVHIHFLLI